MVSLSAVNQLGWYAIALIGGHPEGYAYCDTRDVPGYDLGRISGEVLVGASPT